ncbi:hypothetical protein DY000_02047896 [Brassica cretica]|uniref:Uncharacterized protein n=1 Tax=Brassica cretica TaxID=69181 RepID=A0ABQ7EQQ1_BRACR|nr:hypothetical protein DY000_02047896 [Brassica cretica]
MSRWLKRCGDYFCRRTLRIPTAGNLGLTQDCGGSSSSHSGKLMVPENGSQEAVNFSNVLAKRSDLGTSLWEVAPGSFSTQTRATLGCRCGDLALELERLRVVALGVLLLVTTVALLWSPLVFVVLFSGVVFPNPRSDGDGCLSLVGVFSFFVDPQSPVNDSVLSFALSLNAAAFLDPLFVHIWSILGSALRTLGISWFWFCLPLYLAFGGGSKASEWRCGLSLIDGWRMNEDGTGLAGCVSLSRSIGGSKWGDGRHNDLWKGSLIRNRDVSPCSLSGGDFPGMHMVWPDMESIRFGSSQIEEVGNIP